METHIEQRLTHALNADPITSRHEPLDLSERPFGELRLPGKCEGYRPCACRCCGYCRDDGVNPARPYCSSRLSKKDRRVKIFPDSAIALSIIARKTTQLQSGGRMERHQAISRRHPIRSPLRLGTRGMELSSQPFPPWAPVGYPARRSLMICTMTIFSTEITWNP